MAELSREGEASRLPSGACLHEQESPPPLLAAPPSFLARVDEGDYGLNSKNETKQGRKDDEGEQGKTTLVAQVMRR